MGQNLQGPAVDKKREEYSSFTVPLLFLRVNMGAEV